MSEINLERIKRKSISGVLTLTGRTIFLQLINFLGYFFITIFLERKDFGLFILISALIDILGYFSDVGLAAALIQKKKKPKLKEIRSTFTLQQLLILTTLTILFLFSPLIKKIYSLEKEGIILLYSFAFAFFCSSLKTIPSVLLERKLEFTKIIIPQLIETILFNLAVVILAWKGLGVRSYSVAVLLRAVSGTALIYLLAPWKIGLSFSFKALRKLLKFGLPYQGNTFMALLKDKLMILLLGKIIGVEGVALIGWAEKWANMPLRYFLDSTLKVAFPTFSRLQHDKIRLKRAIEASLYFLSVLIFPSVAGLSLIANSLVQIIPRYLKWQPALLPLYFYSLAALGATVATLLTNALISIGKIKTVFKLMIMWTVLTWLLTPFLATIFGFKGVALAAALISFSSVLAVYVAKKYLAFDLFNHLLPALFSSVVMFVSLLLITKKLPLNIIGVITQILIGVLVYTLSLILINKDKFFKEAKILLSYVKR